MSPGAQASHGKVAASWSAAEEALKGKTASPYKGGGGGGGSRKRAGERTYIRLIKAHMGRQAGRYGQRGLCKVYLHIRGH